jgi:lipopolysaccharide export system protein LptC
MSDWATSARRPHRHEGRIETAAASDERRFRAARRHSGLVRVLRILLPAVIVGAVGGFVTLAYVGSVGIPGVSFKSIDLKSDSLVMDSPHVSGFSGSAQSYELSADRAVQNLRNPEVVTLEGIDARLGIETGDTAKLYAGRGIYDSKAETVSLRDKITVKTSTGYEAEFDSADVDLKNGTLQATEPVELRSADGTIRGNQVEIVEGGKRIIVKNGVSMTLNSLPPVSGDGPKSPRAQ